MGWARCRIFLIDMNRKGSIEYDADKIIKVHVSDARIFDQNARSWGNPEENQLIIIKYIHFIYLLNTRSNSAGVDKINNNQGNSWYV